jgi:hypothetical protein
MKEHETSSCDRKWKSCFLFCLQNCLLTVSAKIGKTFTHIAVLTGQITHVWRLCKDLCFPISSGESKLNSWVCVKLLPGVASNNLKLQRRTAFSWAQEMALLNVEVEMGSEVLHTVL